jgi:hypothetical protein
MMSVSADVICEMEELGLGDRCPKKANGSDDFSIVDVTAEEIEAKRRAVAEIARMADAMSRLVLEASETARELNDTLLRISSKIGSFKNVGGGK